jgi:hypothetical protein
VNRQPFKVESGVWNKPVPRDVVVNTGWGPEFGHDWGVLIDLPHGYQAYLFPHKSLSAESASEVKRLLARDGEVVAYILSCEGNEWRVVVEPTDSQGKFGLTVLTGAGKAIIAGPGEVDASGSWFVNVQTLYPNIRNGRKVEVTAGAKGGTGQKTELFGGLGGTF